MKTIPFLTVIVMSLSYGLSVNAEEPSISPKRYKQILFEDDFSKEGLSRQWGMYKSASTVRDGMMIGITPDDADHPSVNTIRIKPQGDILVSVKFQFAGSKRFSVMYRDKECKSSHAGHICHVAVTPTSLTMYDGKTGIFRKDIREKRKAKHPLDAATKALLKTKSARFKLKLDKTKMHNLEIRIQKNVMESYVDGKLVGRFQSIGLAHVRKDQVNLTTSKKEMHYDDFKISAP